MSKESNSNDAAQDSSGPRTESPRPALPCPVCQCDGTIEGRKGRELQQRIDVLEDALKELYEARFDVAGTPRQEIAFKTAAAALAKVNIPERETETTTQG